MPESAPFPVLQRAVVVVANLVRPVLVLRVFAVGIVAWTSASSCTGKRAGRITRRAAAARGAAPGAAVLVRAADPFRVPGVAAGEVQPGADLELERRKPVRGTVGDRCCAVVAFAWGWVAAAPPDHLFFRHHQKPKPMPITPRSSANQSEPRKLEKSASTGNLLLGMGASVGETDGTSAGERRQHRHNQQDRRLFGSHFFSFCKMVYATLPTTITAPPMAAYWMVVRTWLSRSSAPGSSA